MDGKQIAQWAVGIGIVVLIARMFKGLKPAPGDDDFDYGPDGLWEITTPDPFTRGLREGLVTLADVNEMRTNGAAGRIGDNVAKLVNAEGTFTEDEALAISSVLQRDYREQLLFGTDFYLQTGKTPWAFLVDSIFGPLDLVKYGRTIKKGVYNLRPR